MKALYDTCQAEVKIWKDFPEGAHNDTIAEEGYFEAVEGFIAQHVANSEKQQPQPKLS
jgi:abhydrolase domain-containing protein 13